MSATETNPGIEATKAFEKVQDKYSELGAADSEPNYCYRARIRKIIKGADLDAMIERLNNNDNPWDLFSNKSGYKKANRALTTAFKKAAEVAQKMTHAEVMRMDEYYDLGL